MKNSFGLASLASLLALAAASPLPPTPPGTIYCDIAMVSPPITAVSLTTIATPISGLELAVDITPATLEKSGWTSGWTFTDGAIGAFDGCHYFYLNIGTSAASYKPLTWNFDNQVTTNWVASSGSLIKAAATNTYAETNKFLACKIAGQWVLFLQTGSDKPAGETCYQTNLLVNSS